MRRLVWRQSIRIVIYCNTIDVHSLLADTKCIVTIDHLTLQYKRKTQKRRAGHVMMSILFNDILNFKAAV